MWRQPGAPVLSDLLRARRIFISGKWSCEVYSESPQKPCWGGVWWAGLGEYTVETPTFLVLMPAARGMP